MSHSQQIINPRLKSKSLWLKAYPALLLHGSVMFLFFLFTESPSPFLVLLRKLKRIFLPVYLPSDQHILLPFIKTILPFSAIAVFITEVLQRLRIFRVETLVIQVPVFTNLQYLEDTHTHIHTYINTYLSLEKGQDTHYSILGLPWWLSQ